MFEIKVSTSREISFFAHDANGDGVTGKVDGDFTKRIRKSGGAFGTMTVTISEEENGWYKMTLSTTHTDTPGDLDVSLSATGIKRVNLKWNVVTLVNSDFATSSALATVQADTDDIQSRLPAALVSGRMDCSVGAMAANVMTAAAAAADLTTELQAGLATASAVSAIQSDTDDIQSRLPAALVSGRMDCSVGAMAANTMTAAAAAADLATELQAGLATAASIATAQADLDDIQNRLPAALVSGRIDASVGAMANGVVTAAAVATDAIDADAIADGAIDAGAIASGAITAAKFAANAIAAAAIATDAISGSGVSSAAAEKIADALIGRNIAGGGNSGRKVKDAFAFLRNKWTLLSGTLTIYDTDDTTVLWTGAATQTAGNPVSAIDPA